MARTAWLVTWEWTGEHARPADPIAAILKSQLAPARIRELVEVIYLSTCSVQERVTYTFRPKENPYPAQFVRIGGVPWSGEITCGHNPWLRARRVDNLVVGRNEQDQEVATWNERPKPQASSEIKGRADE